VKLTELDVIRRSLDESMAQEMITTSRVIALEEASFAVRADGSGGPSVSAVSVTERGILRLGFELDPAPGSMRIEFIPWKTARIAISHEVAFGQPGSWRIVIGRDDGPPIELVGARDQGLTDFLKALLAHVNQ
jgi:hypothetical protein